MAALAAAPVAALAVLAAGCGGDPATSADAGPVTVGSKGFPESDVMAAAYAEALRRVGFRPQVRVVEGSRQAARALVEGEISMYPEYTGTYWSTKGGDPLQLVGTGRPAQAAKVRAAMDADPAIHAFAISPGSNNAVGACRPDTGFRSFADLTGRTVSISAVGEAFVRPDAVPGVARAYGFTVGKEVATSSPRRYGPIRRGEVQCTVAYETDPEIKRLGLVVLEDPKGVIAEGVDYRPVALANRAWWDGLSDDARARVAEAIDNVSSKFTTAWLRSASRRVTLGGEHPADVALEVVNISVPGRAAAGG